MWAWCHWLLSYHEEGAQKMTAGDSLIGIGGNYVA